MATPEHANGAPSPAGRRLLELSYEALGAAGRWPTFQYVGACLWQELETEPREVYYELSAAGLVFPAIERTHTFLLRDDTAVGVTLRGLTYVARAENDIGNFVQAVRYIGARAARFRPAVATEVEHPSVTSDEIAAALHLARPGSHTRLSALLRDQAPLLWTTFSGPDETGSWTITINHEWARRFRDVNSVPEMLSIEAALKEESAPHWLRGRGPQPQQPQPAIGPQRDGESPVIKRDTVASSREIDAFICHASEDKEAVARPLATALRDYGLAIWYDEFSLNVGDGLRQSIDRGLAIARRGVVVISPNFFAKEWPQRELDGLVARETTTGERLILPVWHQIDADAIAAHSPLLADRVAARMEDGLAEVVRRLLDALNRSP